MARERGTCWPALAFQCGSTTTALFDPAAGNQRARARLFAACGVSTGEANVRTSPVKWKLRDGSYPKNSSLLSRMARLSAPRYSWGACPFCGNRAADGQLWVHSRPQSNGRTTRLVARKARRFSQSSIQRWYRLRIIEDGWLDRFYQARVSSGVLAGVNVSIRLPRDLLYRGSGRQEPLPALGAGCFGLSGSPRTRGTGPKRIEIINRNADRLKYQQPSVKRGELYLVRKPGSHAPRKQRVFVIMSGGP